MSEKQNIITIDGPAGVGKSTVSKRISAHFGFTYLDTGAMYRGVGLYLKNEGIDLNDDQKIREGLVNLDLRLVPAQHEDEDVGLLLDGKDVSDVIRSTEMAMVASKVSAIPAVRQVLTKIQQSYGLKGKIVAEGRDIGTVVFPEAAYKFFLDAEPQERAKRRVMQMQAKGQTVDYQEILEKIITRDKNDSERDIAPLKQAEDAVKIDTTSISIEDVVVDIIREIEEKKLLL